MNFIMESDNSLVSAMVGLGYSQKDAQIFVRARGHCEYCNTGLMHDRIYFDSVQFDHIIPKSKGGSDDHQNLALTCKVCNTAKSTYLPTGINREALIQDTRRHLQQSRAYANEFWNKVSLAFSMHGYPLIDISGVTREGHLSVELYKTISPYEGTSK